MCKLSNFALSVYDAVCKIPDGRVATYGQIARMIGKPGAARAVGNALHANPYAPAVPCHRVVAADGSLAGNFGAGGPAVQFQRLFAEGVAFLPSDSPGNLRPSPSPSPHSSSPSPSSHFSPKSAPSPSSHFSPKSAPSPRAIQYPRVNLELCGMD